MLTMAQADILIGILSTTFVLGMLGAFTCALFLEKHKREWAIVTGLMTGLLLVVLVLALAAPYLFPTV